MHVSYWTKEKAVTTYFRSKQSLLFDLQNSIPLFHITLMSTQLRIFNIKNLSKQSSNFQYQCNFSMRLHLQLAEQLGVADMLPGAPRAPSNPRAALQSQKAVSAYLWSQQILPYGFARQCPGNQLSAITAHSNESLCWQCYDFTQHSTLVLRSCFNCICFRHLKLELLTQFPAPKNEK